MSPYNSDDEGPIVNSTTTKDTSAARLSNGGSSQEENKFQSAISAWRSVYFECNSKTSSG